MNQSEFLEVLQAHDIEPDPDATFTEIYRQISDDLDLSQRQARRRWNRAVADKLEDDEQAAEDRQTRLDSMPQPPKQPGDEDGDKPESWADLDSDDLEAIPSHRTSRYTAYFHWPSREYWFVFPGPIDPFDIPFEQVQQLVYQYVHAGAGKTQKEVTSWSIRKLNRDMTADIFGKIVKSLGIDKNSPPFAPHVVAEDGDEPEKVAERWRERDEAAIEARYRAGEIDHYRDRYTDLKKQLLSIRDFVRETIEQTGYETVEAHPPDVHFPNPCSADKIPQSWYGDPIIPLSDWHVAKDVSVRVDGREHRYNYEVARERVERLCVQYAQHFQCYNRPMNRAIVTILGDMIDGVHGDMFPGQFRGQEFHGREQCVRAADLIAYAVNYLDRLLPVSVEVEAIGGNHGRDRPDNSEDPTRLPEILTYEIARLKTRDSVDWTIHEDNVGRFKVRNTEILLTHGDSGPRELRDLGWITRADSVLVLSGHSHKDQRDGVSDRHVYHQKNGCLCGVTKFDRDELAKIPRPQQGMVEIRESGPVPGPAFYLDGE